MPGQEVKRITASGDEPCIQPDSVSGGSDAHTKRIKRRIGAHGQLAAHGLSYKKD